RKRETEGEHGAAGRIDTHQHAGQHTAGLILSPPEGGHHVRSYVASGFSRTSYVASGFSRTSGPRRLEPQELTRPGRRVFPVAHEPVRDRVRLRHVEPVMKALQSSIGE